MLPEIAMLVGGAVAGLIFILKSDFHPWDKTKGLRKKKDPPPAPNYYNAHKTVTQLSHETREQERRINILEKQMIKDNAVKKNPGQEWSTTDNSYIVERDMIGATLINYQGVLYKRSQIDWWRVDNRTKVTYDSKLYQKLEDIRDQDKAFPSEPRRVPEITPWIEAKDTSGGNIRFEG